MDGVRITNRFRWMFLAALLVLNNAGLVAGRGAVGWVNVLLLLGVALAAWVSYQLVQGRVMERREVVAIAVVEDLLITAGVGLTGGLDSPLFVLYYPSLVVVGLALPLPTTAAYASALGAVYAALCLLAASGTIAEPVYRFAVVAQRWLALYGLLGLSAWAIRHEQARRSQVEARLAGLQRTNDELQATLDRLAGAWPAADLISEPSAFARSVKAAAAELGDDCRQIEAAVADLSKRAMTADSRQELAMQKSRQAAGIAHDLTSQARPTAIALEQADEAMSRARAVVESWSGRAHEVARLSAAVRRVADRTNLLAFNANIEAIQVGERGRRFAVVADEVRVVGEQAIDMAREIDVLSTEMGEGTQQVLAAMDQLGELLAQASGLAGRALEVGERQHMDAEALRFAADAAAGAARDNAQVAQALWDVVVAQDAALDRLQDSVRRLDGWALAVRDNQRTLEAILARQPGPAGGPAGRLAQR